MATYSSIFLTNNIQGEQLLSFRADDLENLKVECIGHQELILEAIAKLRAFVCIIIFNIHVNNIGVQI